MFAGCARTMRVSTRTLYMNNPYAIINKQFFNVSKRYFVSDSTSSNSGTSYDFRSGYDNHYSSSQQNDVSSQFSYKTAVAYQPKDRDDQIYQKLKDSLLSPTGEDNFFVMANDVSDVYAGVADGVGGWAEHGYDSSAISRELCKAMSEISSVLPDSMKKEGKQYHSPKEILSLAYEKIKKEKIVEVGGTTAVIAHFQRDGTLNIANLGDSWCGVFRDSKLVFGSEYQTVGFNAPFQLSIIPDEMEKEAQRSGRSYIQNTPADADEYNFQLENNDIILLTTDGVTDNIATEDIELFLKDNADKLSNNNLEIVSKDLVNKIVKISKDPEFPSVFAQEISKMTGKLYRGGKEDDITLIMIKVD